MTEKILRCAIYIRVSTAEQAMHGKSLSAQTDYLTQYAKEHQMLIMGIFADEGKTARKNFKDRKAIKQLLEHVRHNEVDVIIFWKMDRWFRNVSDFYKVQDILDAHNTKWIAAAEPNMNMDTREGRLNLNIMLSINQNETDTTSERIRFVNDSSVLSGKVISGAQPFGYKIGISDNGVKNVVKDSDVEHIVDEFFRYYFSHQSQRSALLYLTKKYGEVITFAQVKTLCRNTMYYGRYRNNYNYCPAYITEDYYNFMQDINKRNIKIYTSRTGVPDVYLFSGLICCPICGRKMSANRNEKNSHTGKPLRNVLRYYRCQNWNYKKTCSYSKTANDATIEKYLLNHIEEAAKKCCMNEELNINGIVSKTQAEKKKPDKQKLSAEIERLNNMYQKGRINDERYDTEYTRIITALEQLSEEPKQPPKRTYEDISAILCSGWKDMYHRLDREHQRAFWHSIIKQIHLNEENSFVKAIDLL